MHGEKRISFLVVLLGCVLAAWSSAAAAGELMTQEYGTPAPEDYVLQNASARGEVQHGALRLKIDVQVRAFRDGWTEIPLLQGDYAITAATVAAAGPDAGADAADEEKRPFLQRKGDRFALVTRGKGDLRVALEVACRIDERAGRRAVRLPLIQAVASKTYLIPNYSRRPRH